MAICFDRMATCTTAGGRMITGAHVIVYSTDPDADRAFLRDVLCFPHVDVGEGWLIFALPPSEVAIHPSDRNDGHELYLMCDDIKRFREEMQKAGVSSEEVVNVGWGALTRVRLPGGGTLGVYQPRHERPSQMGKKEPQQKRPRKRA
jgi:hypothetical protein